VSAAAPAGGGDIAVRGGCYATFAYDIGFSTRPGRGAAGCLASEAKRGDAQAPPPGAEVLPVSPRAAGGAAGGAVESRWGGSGRPTRRRSSWYRSHQPLELAMLQLSALVTHRPNARCAARAGRVRFLLTNSKRTELLGLLAQPPAGVQAGQDDEWGFPAKTHASATGSRYPWMSGNVRSRMMPSKPFDSRAAEACFRLVTSSSASL